jgi:hypothetical protein
MFKKRRGQGYLEFVIVLPGMLLLTLLIWEFAYFWWAREVTATATFEAARQVAVGRTAEQGYRAYYEIMSTGLGNLFAPNSDEDGSFVLVIHPERRSVSASSLVPYRWPTGLGALMGGRMKLDLRASAFFRLEEFYPGPPAQFE